MTEEIRIDSATSATSKYRKEKRNLENCQISVEVTANLLWSFPYFSLEKKVKGLKQEM